MFNNGMKISEMDRERIVVKVPVTAEGTKAATMLGSLGVRICLTACYNSNQALIAGSMGVEYIAPYLGRYVNTIGKNVLQSNREISQIYIRIIHKNE